MLVRGSRANNRKAMFVHFQAMEASAGPVFSHEDHRPKLVLADFSLSFFHMRICPAPSQIPPVKESAGETKDTVQDPSVPCPSPIPILRP